MRKIFLVNKPFQIKFIIFMVIVSSIPIVSGYWFFKDVFTAFLVFANNTGVGYDHPFRHLLFNQWARVNWFFVGMTLVTWVVTILSGIWISHRIAGPIHRIVKNLKNPGGDPMLKFVTRKGDYFKELSEAQIAMDKMKTEFVAMVSHELRTPLTSLYGSLKILQAGTLQGQEDRIQKQLEVSTNNAERLIHIVNDILDLTKIESGKFSINKTEGDLNRTIRESIDEMQSYFQKCGVTVDCAFEKESFMAEYDQGRIAQVLANLLSNAAKFSKVGSKIHVAVIRADGALQVEIQDSGAGIPDELQDKVFQKFSKINISESKTIPGTGLGLSISKTLVELHQGKIWFHSKVGEGTTFYFTLPFIYKK